MVSRFAEWELLASFSIKSSFRRLSISVLAFLPQWSSVSDFLSLSSGIFFQYFQRHIQIFVKLFEFFNEIQMIRFQGSHPSFHKARRSVYILCFLIIKQSAFCRIRENSELTHERSSYVCSKRFSQRYAVQLDELFERSHYCSSVRFLQKLAASPLLRLSRY